MHWETSRNRERFAATIERLVLAAENRKDEELRKAKRERQSQRCNPDNISFRQGLTADETANLYVRRRTGQTSANGSAENGNAHPEAHPLSKNLSQPERAMTWGTQLRNQFGFPKTPFEMDSNRRVKIVRAESAAMEGSDAKKIGSRLGQYLIDAARLFE